MPPTSQRHVCLPSHKETKCKLLMSLYLIRPVASLTVEVEDESGRTADGSETVASLEVVLDAAHGVPD